MAAASVSFSAPAAAAESDGFVLIAAAGATIYTPDALADGQQVRLQSPGNGRRGKCCTTASVTGVGRPQDIVSDELHDQAVHAYAIAPAPSLRGLPAFVGVFSTADPGAMSKATSHARPVLQSCFSTEGVHLMKRVRGKLTTHLYMRLDYAVEPTCSASTLRLLAR